MAGTAKYRAYPVYKPSGVAWLGSYPSHWEMRKSKHIFKKIQRIPRDTDGIVTAFRDGEVTLRANRRTDGFTNAVKEIGYQGVRQGDLLVHAMDGFAGAIGISDSDGKCSPVCSVCVSLFPTKTSMNYYGYLVRQLAITDFITSLAKGIRERSTEFRYSEFSGLLLAFPPLLEQTKIAAFLDYETAKIDALITKQQRLIALLEEKRQAVISHAVAKGLDPTAPLRPSGIDWLGDVPAHWEVSRLKHVATVKGRIGFRGYTVEDLVTADEGALVLGAAEMGSIGELRLSNSQYISWKKYYESPEIMLKPNMVLFVQRGSVGKVAHIADDIGPATINPSLIVLRDIEISAKFLTISLMSNVLQNVVKLQTSSTAVPMISQEQVGNYFQLIPPIEEQLRITKFVEGRLHKIDETLSKIHSAITLLKERRTALISAAVTGKIDLREWQAPEDAPDSTPHERAFA
tara:strand:+ start:2907 stop:4286 length:1380 start_codon:yes stop_codon:yes gene_type:complete